MLLNLGKSIPISVVVCRINEALHGDDTRNRDASRGQRPIVLAQELWTYLCKSGLSAIAWQIAAPLIVLLFESVLHRQSPLASWSRRRHTRSPRHSCNIRSFTAPLLLASRQRKR